MASEVGVGRSRVCVMPSMLALGLMACASFPPAVPYRAPGAFPERGGTLVVLGDTQRTSGLEFWRESNPEERRRILSAVAAAAPDLVLFTGDLVFNGGDDDDWAFFDEVATPLRATHAAVIAARGNHEYWGSDEVGWKNWRARFPYLPERWYAVDLGALRVIVLDSNVDELSEADWATQLEWYAHQLETADREARVRGVVVAFHHPPYTNSTVTGDEAHVQRDLVPPFARARKTCVLLTGHAHTYERYVRGEKTYVVSGGGGGPRAKLAEGGERRHTDDTFEGPALRDFNFTVYTVTDEGLDAMVWGLPKGGEAVKPMSTFSVPWAPLP
ncbi:MAG: metallophosphoesterase [Archangium sp.]|nr:metallophosphoesterase [Archangium sp.]